MRGLFGPGTWVLGGGAVLLGGFLIVGFFLPGTWEADAQRTIEAEIGTLLPYLDSPEGWAAWTTWPDSGLTREGPDRGPGAEIAWSDRELGSGSFRIDAVDPTRVTYSVSVEGAGGSVMVTSGSVALEERGRRTDVSWHEEGDLGRNPLMGYWARSMARAQGAEMSKSLDRLAEVVDSADGGSPRQR